MTSCNTRIVLTQQQERMKQEGQQTGAGQHVLQQTGPVAGLATDKQPADDTQPGKLVEFLTILGSMARSIIHGPLLEDYL